jgi:CRP-like cAMP-binding protein
MIKYYGIPEDILIKTVLYLEHIQKKKKQKIYSIGDSSDYFYIIVRGIVYLEEKGEIIKGVQQYNQKCILKEGFCFGEFEILNEQNRICNAYAKENCNLLGIKKEKFLKTISKYILKSENERKNLIMNFIPCFKQMTSQKFLLYYNNFLLEKIVKQNYIYKEQTEANSLFLILQGRSRFVKNGKNILYLGNNDLVGFESINFEPESNENPTYNCSLIAIDDCFVLRIQIKNLGNLRFKIRKQLSQININKNNLFNHLIEQGKKEREKLKISYREKLFKENIRNTFKKLPIEKIKQYFYTPEELKENKIKLNTIFLKLKINTDEDTNNKNNSIFKLNTNRFEIKKKFKTLSPLNSETKILTETKNEFISLSDKNITEKKEMNLIKRRVKTISEIDNNVLQKSIGIRTNILRNIYSKKVRNYSINTGDFDLPLITMYKSCSYRKNFYK